MNASVHVVSLVLASATGWTLLVLGALPVTLLRQLPREPLLGAGAWALVAATAPSGVFHWYLIFAVLCLIAYTKLHRPAGKVWLALSAALGLSLGIVFPLEIDPWLLKEESPLALASLYLGGAATGLAYVLALTVFEAGGKAAQALGLALILVAMGWMILLGLELPRLVPTDLQLQGHLRTWMPIPLAVLSVVLAFCVRRSLGRGELGWARWLALAGSVTAFGTGLLAQFVIRAAEALRFLAST